MSNKAVRQIVVCAVILFVVGVFCRLVFFRSFTFYLPIDALNYQPPAQPLDPGSAEENPQQDLEVRSETPGIIQAGEPELKGDFVRISVSPEGSGQTWIEVMDPRDEDPAAMTNLHVGKLKTVYDHSTGGFTGDRVVLLCVTIFCLLVSLITMHAFLKATGPEFYSYYSIFYVGLFLFSLYTGLMMLTVTVRHFIDPAGFPMLSAYSAISGAAGTFILFTSPLILVFSLAMIISNIELLRHERPRTQNLLGILIGVLLIVGAGVGIFLRFRDFSGSEWEYRIRQTIDNSYAALYVYFECILAGAVICGFRAAKHIPPRDRDFIVILGCWFRKDGSLPPLLKGRVDRAIAFWKDQKEVAGKEAVFIPSGGQGRSESMPEAEAMGRYLRSCGIPEERILKEDQSRNTYQNMAFSRKLIEERSSHAKVAFSTTNYHVFRSGVWAGLAGLAAEGMGSRTRWWYWPNAFMRECVGLLRNRIRQEIGLMIFFVVLFGILSIALG